MSRWSGVLCLVVAGCSNGPSVADTGVADVPVADSGAMDVIPRDTGVDVPAVDVVDAAPMDLGVDVPVVDIVEASVPTGCAGLQACLAACSTATCMSACQAHATTNANALWSSLSSCSLGACQADFNDASVEPCTDPTTAACAMCESETRHGGAAGACANPGGLYCGMCSSQEDACLADTP